MSSYGHFGFSELQRDGGRAAGAWLDGGWMQCWVAGCCCCDAPGAPARSTKRRGKGKQMLTIRSLALVCERKEVECTYLGNLLDFGGKLEKCVVAR